MKYTLALLALAGAAMAQSSSSAAPASSSSTSAASSSAPASSASAAPDAGSSSACEAFPGYLEGTVHVPNYGCQYTTTSTPTYDSASLQSYLIGDYTRGPEGVAISDVATQMAESVVKYYPTLTVSFSDIVQQYVSGIEASISTAANGGPIPDSASLPQSNKLLGVGAALAAVVAGGAFML